MQYRADIDALRGVAVGAVLIFHAFPSALPGGYLGVDVFFVISGFLITSIIYRQFQDNTFTLWGFYKRRIARLTPSLIVVLAATLVLGWVFMLPEEFERVGFHIFRSSVYWMNFTLIDEIGYFDVDAIYKPLLHLWSLAVEEHFYIIWPLVFLILKGRLRPLRLALWCIAIASIAANYAFYIEDQNAAFLHSLGRFWQLSVGGLLALYSLKLGNSSTPLGLFALIVLLTCIVLFDERDTHPLKTLIPTLATALLIHAAVAMKSFGGLRQIGLISYPLYLWHWVVISFLAIVTGGALTPQLAWLAIALSLLLGTFNYLFIEPLRYVRNSHRFLIPGLLSVGVIGGLVNEFDGLTDRGHLAYLNGIDAQLERGPSTDTACNEVAASVLETDRMFAYCRSSLENNDTRPVFAVIGDSHAHALFDGFEKVAKEQGYATLLLANSSCPTLEGFRWGKDAAGKILCQQAIDQILTILENTPQLERVLISTRGPVYLHGEVVGKHTEQSVAESLTEEVDPDLTYQSLSSGLRATLDRLSPLNLDKTFYLLENPELDYSPKASIPRPMMPPAEEFAMQRDLYSIRMQPYRDAIAQGLRTDTILLDPTDFFCDENRCTHFRGGFLYSDDDHTSIYGAEQLTRHLADRLFSDKNRAE